MIEVDGVLPAGVRVLVTTREDGNLADAEPRRSLRARVGWPEEPLWLNQVHGAVVVDADAAWSQAPEADGAVTRSPGRPVVVRTADCLPVVACDAAGTVAGVFHAGWRGLAAGVLEAGVAALGVPAREVRAWIGPAIGAASYQVDAAVRDAFVGRDRAYAEDFTDDGPGHWRFDLAGAAVRTLARAGVTTVTRSGWDTASDSTRWFSHRREGPTGRLATAVWLTGERRDP